jgi:hypothetical protein
MMMSSNCIVAEEHEASQSGMNLSTKKTHRRELLKQTNKVYLGVLTSVVEPHWPKFKNTARHSPSKTCTCTAIVWLE